MKIYTLLFLFVSVTQLFGCAQQTIMSRPDYDSSHFARVRVLGAGEMIYLYPGKDCYPLVLAGSGDENGIQASGGMANNIQLAFGGIDNMSIGMPVGTAAKKPRAGNLWTNGYFKEFVIPASQIMTIRMVLGGNSTAYHGGFAYTPAAGHDYEIYIDCPNGKGCYGIVNELDAQGNPAQSVKTTRVDKCKIQMERGFE